MASASWGRGVTGYFPSGDRLPAAASPAPKRPFRHPSGTTENEAYGPSCLAVLQHRLGPSGPEDL